MAPSLAVFAAGILCALGDASADVWLRDPSLSPDGRTIAFRFDGDLYTVSVNGGIAVPLSRAAAHETKPLWLDSHTLAFGARTHGNYDVFSADIDRREPPRRLTWHAYDDLPVARDGRNILIRSDRLDLVSAGIPYPAPLWSDRPGLFSLPADGGVPRFVLDPAVLDAAVLPGGQLIFTDRPSIENPVRKHERSPATTDIWLKDGNSFRRLTFHDGHDSSPVWNAANGYIYYLSERSGTQNVWRMKSTGDNSAQQVTFSERHPVRGLSISDNGLIVYGLHGSIYAGRESFRRVDIAIPEDPPAAPGHDSDPQSVVIGEALALSENESVVTESGRTFVVARQADGAREIFDQHPCVKHSPSVSQDHRRLLVVCDHGDRSSLLIAELPRSSESWADEKITANVRSFGTTEEVIHAATLSPDGTQVVYTTSQAVKVVGTGKAAARELLNRAGGYYEPDQRIAWHPAGKHVALEWTRNERRISDIAVLRISDGRVVNVSQSGFNDTQPQWVENGHALVWVSQRDGLRHFGKAVTSDIYAIFFTAEARRAFLSRDTLSTPLTAADFDRSLTGVTKSLEALRANRERLTESDSAIATVQVSADMSYSVRLLESGDLWRTRLSDGEDRRILGIPAPPVSTVDIVPSLQVADGNGMLFVHAAGGTGWVDPEEQRLSGVALERGRLGDVPAARRHRWMFDRTVRGVEEGYYRPDYLKRIDWPTTVENYRSMVATLSDPQEFAELMNEMLGELNSSHTGFFFTPPMEEESAGSLAVIYDMEDDAPGWKIAEVLGGSPLREAAPAEAGDLIVEFDGQPVSPSADPARYLLGKAATAVCLTLLHKDGKHSTVTVSPISLAGERELLYERWRAWQRRQTDVRSGNLLAYVHMRSMEEEDFRSIVDDLFGAYADRAGVILDLRYNEGGWMHEPLIAFLIQPYAFSLEAFGTVYASEPVMRLGKPLDVLANAAIYSNAYETLWLIQELGLATIVGGPVAGTGLGASSLPFPFAGYEAEFAHDVSVTQNGNYMENLAVMPDIYVPADRSELRDTRDLQLEAAIDHLLRTRNRDSATP